MLIIVEKKISQTAKERLAALGELLELETENITYPAISGHPDIFFFKSTESLVVAPNLPDKYFSVLDEHQIDYVKGELPVGHKYPATARYNAVATSNYLIHNFRHTDFMITRLHEDLQLIHTDQGYCRCNLLPLKEDHFIVSDQGIYKVLIKGCHPLLVGNESILLEGFSHGFFGGCCGVHEDKVFINGSLKHYKDGEKVKAFLAGLNYSIVELFDGPLVDVGSILFIPYGEI
jgi:hypothetical protein